MANYIFYFNIASNLENLLHSNSGLEDSFYEGLREEMSERISLLLEAELPNEIKRTSPDFFFEEKFNPMIHYDRTTFKGVMAEFMRNILEIIGRRNVTNV